MCLRFWAARADVSFKFRVIRSIRLPQTGLLSRRLFVQQFGKDLLRVSPFRCCASRFLNGTFFTRERTEDAAWAGTYHCVAENYSGRTFSRNITVSSAYIRHSFLQNPESGKVLAGEEIKLKCLAPKGYPACGLDKSSITPKRIYSGHSVLEIPSVYLHAITNHPGLFLPKIRNNFLITIKWL